jgi:hypothetical protein
LTADVPALPEAPIYSRPGNLPGLFVFAPSRAFNIGEEMTETYSKSRQRAEIAFGNIQSQFFAKNKAMEELESRVQSQQAKTLRLREARLAKQRDDRASATSALLAKRAKAC